MSALTAAVRLPLIAFVRADAKKWYPDSQDSELCAGEMFVPAGYSPGRSVCARGGRSAWREQFFVAALGVRFTPVMRFCWSVLRSFTPVSFPLTGKERRLAGGCVLFRRGSGSPLVRSRSVMRLSDFGSSPWDCAFSYGDPDEVRRNGKTGKRKSAAWRGGLLRGRIGFDMFSAGSPLGATRPQTCAKEPLALWTLFI